MLGFQEWPNADTTIAVTMLDGEPIFGVNSTAPLHLYPDEDRARADRYRDMLIETHPDVMQTINIGQKPNDSVYHAESHALLGAAVENGGTLKGRHLAIYVDRIMCPSCEAVLPLLALKLGNPTVTIIDASGVRQTLRNGRWD
jgi:hypothetical protein